MSEHPDATREILEIATAEAAGARAEAVEPLHLLIAVCRSELPQIRQAFEVHGIDPVRFRRRVRGFARQVGTTSESGPIRVSGRVRRLLELAGKEAGSLLRPVDAVCVFVALLRSPDVHVEQVLDIERVPSADLVRYLDSMLTRLGGGAAGRDAGGIPTPLDVAVSEPPSSATPALDLYGKDYTALARAGAFDPIIGRGEEIKQVVRVLLRKQKNNPVLVGDAGVGKTRIVEGLAVRAVAENAPPSVSNLRIVEILLSTLVAGTDHRGQFEERFNQVAAEAEANPGVVLFFDEIHTLVGAGAAKGGLDASGIFRPALARGRIRCIGTTTLAEYRRHVERDPELERRFQPIPVEESTPEQAREILLGLRATYESYHGVVITDDAIDAAVDLSVRYLPDRRLPDKACELIDQAAASKRFMTFSPAKSTPSGDPLVSGDDVARVVSEVTGLSVERLAEDRQQRLLRMEDALKRRVVGQDLAVATVARVVRTGFAGLARPDRPRGVFLFLGPSGVGKTELAKALAEYLYDDERRLVRFDMAEFAEEQSVAKLIGAPRGYVGHDDGGALVEAVRRTPHSVILFEEVEKAHSKVTELFVKIFDDGRLADSHGRVADFRNAIIILTSNIGSGGGCWSGPGSSEAESGEEPAGAAPPAEEAAESPDDLRRELLEHFRPELLNRISRVVPFRSLDLKDVRTVIDRIVDRVREQRLHDKGVTLHLTPSAYDALFEMGFKPSCGVREMERAVERQIVEPLAQGVIDGRFKRGDAVDVVATGGAIRLERRGKSKGKG